MSCSRAGGLNVASRTQTWRCQCRSGSTTRCVQTSIRPCPVFIVAPARRNVLTAGLLPSMTRGAARQLVLENHNKLRKPHVRRTPPHRRPPALLVIGYVVTHVIRPINVFMSHALGAALGAILESLTLPASPSLVTRPHRPTAPPSALSPQAPKPPKAPTGPIHRIQLIPQYTATHDAPTHQQHQRPTPCDICY
jgi:hypothetical protein